MSLFYVIIRPVVLLIHGGAYTALICSDISDHHDPFAELGPQGRLHTQLLICGNS